MVRKERKQEQKKPKSKVKKKLAPAKKSPVAKVAKVEKNKSETVATVPPMLPIDDLLSVVRLGICFFDKDDKVVFCNEHFSEITGLQLEKLAGKKLRKNMLWGARGQQDEFQELFNQARESGMPLIRDRLQVGTGEENERYWNLNLLPKYENNAEYSGMYLVIEDVSAIRPRAGIMELINGLQRAALHQNEMQGLLNDLAGVLKDFSNCSYIKIALIDRPANQVIRAETGGGPGLWDADQALSNDSIRMIFNEDGSEIPPYRTSGGSIYLEDINQTEDNLEGALKDLVINARNTYGFQSLALIPIKLDNRVSGFIQMSNKKAGGIPGETLEVVENTADLLKIILDRIGLKDDVRRQRENLLRQMHERSAHLEALSERLKQEISERKKAQEEMRVQRDLATELSATDNMDSALRLCLDSAMRAAGADSGGIYIIERQTGQLILMCSKGLSDEFVKTTSHYDAASPNAQLVMGMKTIYTHFNDLESSLGGLYKMEGLKGTGVIPIVHNGRAIGCLNIASHVHDEIPLNLRSSLETVAAQIGSVIGRMQDRKALEDSEERYRTLFARTANPILVIDTDGNYIDSNDAALAFLECTREELLAMNVRNTLPPYLDEQWYDHYRSEWENGGTVERDYYVWGKIKVLEETITPMQLGGRKIVFGIGKDITERKKVELALRESEEKYRQHFINVSDVIYSLDLDLRVVDMSPSVERLLGYRVDELVGRQFEELNVLAPESVPIAYENLKTILAGGRVESSEYQFIAKDGTRKYGEVSGAPIFHDNKLIGIVSVARDTTERKRAQDALRASEEMFKNIVEHSSEIFFIQDIERNLKYISPQIESISGYSREELSSGWRELMTENPMNQENQKYVEEAVRTGEKQPVYNYEFYKKDGEAILLEVNETPTKDENGKVTGFVGIARDITEHNKIEKALIASESKYRSVVESGGAGVATVNMGGQITFANDTLCRMTGYSMEEVLMKRYIDFLHPEDRENTIKLMTEVVEGKKLTDYVQFRLVCKDGRARWFYANPTGIDLNGQIVGFTAILQDITERKNAEKALSESEEKYRSVVENANEGILVMQDGQFKYANDRLVGFSQYTREEARLVAVDPFDNLLYPDDREMVLQNYLKRRRGEQAPMQYEFRWMDKGGLLRWADLRISEFLWEGKPASLCFIMDITDRKRAEQALVESEQKFKDLADLLPQVVFEADTEGIITYFNKRGYEVFGYTPDEVIGKMNITDVIIPAERESALKNYFGILAGETATGHEYMALRKDSSTFDTIVFANSIIEGARAIGLRGAFTDVSLIKRAENALRESEEKYRSVVENAAEAIYIAQDGKVKYANRRTFEIIHYTKEELFSIPFIDVIHPEDKEVVAQRYAKRVRGEETVPVYAFRIIDKDSTVKWLELRATLIQWEGRPATLNIVTDITERKQAEQALKESGERYRLLAENSLDVIWTADMQGEITYVSPSIRYFIGRSADEIMDMYKRGTLTPDVFGVAEEDSKRFLNGLQTLRQDPSRTLTFEFGLKHSDGFTSWVEAKMSIMRDQNSQAAGILGIVRDITQQKKMTERLVSTDRLASLGEMAGGLAHEVNNPLTAVMGFAYLLQQNPNTPPEIKNDVDAIYREGKRAAEVIKSFLIFARGQKPQKQAVYINDILEGVLRLRHSQMSKENIEVATNLAEDIPAVQGDVSQLQQAFLNIILNAEYFMYKSHHGGHLSLSSVLADEKIVVLIGDDGPGILPEKLNRVFDPFYTTKDVGEGVGLGLSICHGIIREHGGEINVESSPGKGATFIIELPVGK